MIDWIGYALSAIVGWAMCELVHRQSSPLQYASTESIARFEPESVVKVTPEYWEQSEWLHYENSMYLIKVPVKLSRFHILAYRVMVDGEPLSIATMAREKFTRNEAESIQRMLLARGFVQWRNHEKRAGVRLTWDGERMMAAASRLHYATLPHATRLSLRKAKAGERGQYSIDNTGER